MFFAHVHNITCTECRFEVVARTGYSGREESGRYPLLPHHRAASSAAPRADRPSTIVSSSYP